MLSSWYGKNKTAYKPFHIVRFAFWIHWSSPENINVKIKKFMKPEIYLSLKCRLSLKEYCLYWNLPFITLILVFYLLGRKGNNFDTKVISSFNLFILWPVIATSVKRLHDLNKSGWWFLLHIFPLIGLIILEIFLCFIPGTKGVNEFE